VSASAGDLFLTSPFSYIHKPKQKLALSLIGIFIGTAPMRAVSLINSKSKDKTLKLLIGGFNLHAANLHYSTLFEMKLALQQLALPSYLYLLRIIMSPSVFGYDSKTCPNRGFI
jgi:hypothetical protein